MANFISIARVSFTMFNSAEIINMTGIYKQICLLFAQSIFTLKKKSLPIQTQGIRDEDIFWDYKLQLST